MQMPNRFVVEKFQLELNHAAYIVEVSPNNETHDLGNLTELPGWVFHSRHAIWFTTGTTPLMERALEGERIKKKLFSKLSKKLGRKKKQSSLLLPDAIKLIALHSHS